MDEDKQQQTQGLFSQTNNPVSLFGTTSQQQQDNSEVRRKREEYSMEIRAKDRESQLSLKRKANLKTTPTQSQMISSKLPPEIQQKLKEQLDTLQKRNFQFEEFPQILQSIASDDLLVKHWGVTGLRKILSVEKDPPIQPVIDANLVPTLIEIIQTDMSSLLTLEAAWALTNVASGTTQQTQTIIDKGGIQLFVKLLSSPYPEIAEQAVWAIGNVAGDCAQYRDLILRSGGVDPLIKIIENSTSKNTVKHGTWSLSNLCRGKPLPEFKYVKNATPVLCKVIIEETDQEVLTDACWALSYLSDGDNTRIQTVINTGVVPSLIKLMDHPFLSILIPSLRILGNLVTGDDSQTNFILDQGILIKLVSLLSHDKKPVRREACWTISNITAGNEAQISVVVRELQIVEKLFMLMKNDSADIKREASWAISNATNNGSNADIHFLAQHGLIDVFVEMLDCTDVKTLTVILEALSNVLKRGDTESGDNAYLSHVEALNGVKKLELLQRHTNQEVYQKSYAILDRYYDPEFEL